MKDAISLLYSQEDIDQYVTYPFAETNGYEVLSNAEHALTIPGPTWTLNMLMAGGLSNYYSVNAGDTILVN